MSCDLVPVVMLANTMSVWFANYQGKLQTMDVIIFAYICIFLHMLACICVTAERTKRAGNKVSGLFSSGLNIFKGD